MRNEMNNYLEIGNQNPTTINETKETTINILPWKIAQAAEDRKGSEILILKVEGICYLTDYFVIVTGFSKAQVRAISDSIEEKIARECQKEPLRISGRTDANWILQDYGDVIAHIFLPQEREYYNLEAFWGHAEKIEFSQSN